MTTPSIDAHVHLDLHPTHSSAVTAVLTGSQAHIALLCLEADGWTAVAENTLVLARIDSEEPYWADKAADALNAEGIPTEITPRLRAAIDEEWTWADYPTPWCTRSEIREVSNEAQKIYDDIRHGHLLIHAHAEDSHTTVAVGTYLSGGKSVYLHGENHLRQVADTRSISSASLQDGQNQHIASREHRAWAGDWSRIKSSTKVVRQRHGRGSSSFTIGVTAGAATAMAVQGYPCVVIR